LALCYDNSVIHLMPTIIVIDDDILSDESVVHIIQNNKELKIIVNDIMRTREIDTRNLIPILDASPM
jgi:hypothetical protein